MTTETKKTTASDVEYYLKLPYAIMLQRDEDGDFVARIRDLKGCAAHGKTETEAIETLREVQRLWLEESLAGGVRIPEPQKYEGLPSGKWVQRAPRSLHKKLTDRAVEEGVSLNQLVTAILSEAIGRRRR